MRWSAQPPRHGRLASEVMLSSIWLRVVDPLTTRKSSAASGKCEACHAMMGANAYLCKIRRLQSCMSMVARDYLYDAPAPSPNTIGDRAMQASEVMLSASWLQVVDPLTGQIISGRLSSSALPTMHSAHRPCRHRPHTCTTHRQPRAQAGGTPNGAQACSASQPGVPPPPPHTATRTPYLIEHVAEGLVVCKGLHDDALVLVPHVKQRLHGGRGREGRGRGRAGGGGLVGRRGERRPGTQGGHAVTYLGSCCWGAHAGRLGSCRADEMLSAALHSTSTAARLQGIVLQALAAATSRDTRP